jgi:DNA replication protein DnaC
MDAMSKIEETLKKIAAATSKENSLNSSTTDRKPLRRARDLPGDPNCPICKGVGYIRLDVPVDHPDFGRVHVCSCRQGQVSQEIGDRLYALSNLEQLRHLTFDNFQPRGRIGLSPYKAESLQRAYNHARLFAQNLTGWILLQGGYGCGKTHLAAAVANFAVSLGVPTLFITVPDLLDSLRFAYNDPDASFEERFDEIRRSPLLVLDDFGTQNTTPWAQEKLFQIINYRYVNRLATLVTTNLLMEDIDERIRSRLMDPELVTSVHILATDYRDPSDDTGHPELSSLAMHKDQTFSRFEDRRGEGISSDDIQNLQTALRAAVNYAKTPEGWLILTGDASCGKTHLAAAIANHRSELGFPPLFISVLDLLDHLRATFAPNSPVRYDRRFNDIKTAPLLILDDLGTHSATPWAQEKLYQLFDYRYNAKLPTVITMSKSMEELNKTEPHLASRMLDQRLCHLIAIIAPAYRGAPAAGTGKGRPRRSADRR